MPPKRYEEIRLELVDEDGNATPIGQLVAAARDAATAGLYRETVQQMFSLVHQVEDIGLADVALEILQDLREIVPEQQLLPTEYGWLLNYEGLALNALGRRYEAQQRYEEVLSVGKTLEDKELMAVAQHNLGIQAYFRKDFELARRYYYESAQVKLDTEDLYSVIQLLSNISSLELEVGNLNEAEHLLEDLELAIKTSQAPHLRMTHSALKGQLAAQREDFVTAERCFRQALKYARQAGDLAAETKAMVSIGDMLREQEDFTNALRWSGRAVRLAEGINSTPGMIDAHNALAMALYRQRRIKEAIKHVEIARDLAADIDARHQWATFTANLGAMLVELGFIERADKLLDEALNAFHELGNIDEEIRMLISSALIKYRIQDIEAADAYVEQAITLLPPEAHIQKADLLEEVARAIDTRPAMRARAVNYYTRSITEYEELVKTSEDVEEQGKLAWRIVQAASSLRDAGADEESLPFYARALTLYEKLGEDQFAFRTRVDRANRLINLGRFKSAHEDYNICFALATRLEDRAMELLTSMNLAELVRQEGDIEESLRLADRTLELARELGDTESEVAILANRATALVDANRLEEADELFKHALEGARRLHKSEAEARIIAGLANIAFIRGQYNEAARLYEESSKASQATGDQISYLESLGAALECFAAAGQKDQVQKKGQLLINTAQKLEVYDPIYKSLARAGRWYLRRKEIDEAANFYEAGIELTMNALVEAEAEFLWSEVTKVVLHMVFHAKEELDVEASNLYENVLNRLDKHGLGLRSIMQETLEVAIQAAEKALAKSSYNTEPGIVETSGEQSN